MPMNAMRTMIQQWVKLALALLSAECLNLTGLSQGILEFNNDNEPFVDAPIFDVDGKTPLTGRGFLAELYAAAPGQPLQPVSDSITPFLTGNSAGYFAALTVAVPGVSAGSTATVQVVAWRASDGATFAAANHFGAHIGESSVFNVGPLWSPSWPPSTFPTPITGLQSFSLQVVVPEPSVFAFGLLGGALLALDPDPGEDQTRSTMNCWTAPWWLMRLNPAGVPNLA